MYFCSLHRMLVTRKAPLGFNETATSFDSKTRIEGELGVKLFLGITDRDVHYLL